MKSPMICDPITLPMSAPTADGSAAAVVCSEEFMIARGLQVSKVRERGEVVVIFGGKMKSL